MTQRLDFKENSRQIAQHFLQSVVAVDDSIIFEQRPVIDDDVIVEPGDTELGEFEAKNDDEATKAPLKHGLYYQDLSHEFASKGIICGGFAPKGEVVSSLEAVVNTSKNADITILDWQMEIAGPDGQFAIDTTLRISEIDIKEGGRTRLICIYTAQDVDKVANKLLISLQNLRAKLEENTITFGLPELTHWKIEIVNKADKQEIDLCDFLIESFTQLTTGLLSNAVVSSIATIRDNTHNFLHKFNSTLDAAYISHILGLISSPKMRDQAHDVAFDYAVELISEELKSTLQINEKVKKSLSKEIISCWPDFVAAGDEDNEIFIMNLSGGETLSFNKAWMKKLLAAIDIQDTLNNIGMEAGTKKVELLAKTTQKLANESDHSKIEPILNKSGAIKVTEKKPKPAKRFENEAIQLSIHQVCEKPLLDLCSIENTRRCQSTILHKAPSLKQGTVIKDSDGNYFLCIQPLCDSVRLNEVTSFTFIKIDEVTSPRAKFSHVLKRADNTHLKLLISSKATTVRTFDFQPSVDDKVVLSTNETDKYYFEDVSDKIKFEWYGEFKQSITQAIVNNLAAQISRVGNDSFEWLRQKQG